MYYENKQPNIREKRKEKEQKRNTCNTSEIKIRYTPY